MDKGKMEDIRTQALKSLSNLTSLILRKQLAERLISRSTADILTDPFKKMDWQEKKKRADELIPILETSKTEEEILQRASMLESELETSSKVDEKYLNEWAAKGRMMLIEDDISIEEYLQTDNHKKRSFLEFLKGLLR